MEAIISRSSVAEYPPSRRLRREFATLEEFIAWVNEQDHPVIVWVEEDGVVSLEIYDHYRE